MTSGQNSSRSQPIDLDAAARLVDMLERDLAMQVGAGLEGLAGRPLPFGDAGRNVFLVDASVGLRWSETPRAFEARHRPLHVRID